jgi:hypothetical protein
MVSAVRKGKSIRAVAKQFRVGVATVQRWVKRAAGRRLDRVDFSDRPCRPVRTNRTAQAVEDLVLDIRRALKDESPLGEYGAAAIRGDLLAGAIVTAPSVRTIGRILERRGVLDGNRRLRRSAPPKGWYLPDALALQTEVDCFDIIEDLRIADGPLVDVLTVTSLHGRLSAAWPFKAPVTARITLRTLLNHWRVFQLPGYAQFDNDTRFQGPHQHKDTISRVVRLCRSLGVTPVFAPPRETGFQASIENFNRRWQDVVWHRFHHHCLTELQQRSQRHGEALRQRNASYIENAPARQPIPKDWKLNLQAHPSGRLIYLRRTSADGKASLLGHTFHVDPHWPHRLVRCEVDLDHDTIRFFALRRRDPDWQPLLNELEHTIPRRPFRE